MSSPWMAGPSCITNQIICQLGLLLFLLSARTSASYVRHYNDASTVFLTPEARAICRNTLNASDVTPRGRCLAFATCILQNLDDYALAGANSGTTLLALIPPALAVFATGRMREHSLLDGGLLKRLLKKQVSQRVEAIILLLSAAFAGTYSPGLALWKIAQTLDERKKVSSQAHAQNKRQADKAHVETNAEDIYLPRKYFSTLTSRIPVYIVLFGTMATILYLWCIIGFRTVVTWACNWDILVVMWAAFRACPLLFETLILLVINKWLAKDKIISTTTTSSRSAQLNSAYELDLRSPDAEESQNMIKNGARSATTDARADHSDASGQRAKNISQAEIRLISITHMIIRILDFGLTLLGTGILGSAILMDGGVALYYLLGIPMLYGALNVCCGLLE